MARRRFAALAAVVVAIGGLVVTPTTAADATPAASFRPHSAAHARAAATSGPVVRGKVTDAAGEPLGGVVIYSFPTGFARSTAEGTYRVRLAPGTRRVYFDGARATTLVGGGTGYLSVSRTFVVGTQPMRAATVVLAPGAAVTGKVVDQQGQPLRYASMAVLPISQSPPYVDAIDDEGDYDGTSGGTDVVESRRSGHFTITGAAAEAVLVCFAAQDLEGVPTGGSAGNYGYDSACTSRPIVLVPGRTLTVGRIVLPTAHNGLIVGKVTRPGGRGIAYSLVFASADTKPYLSTEADAGPDGSFASPSVPAGRYQVCALAYPQADDPVGGYQAPCTRYEPVTAGKITRINIRMSRGAAARGQVLSRSGKPLAHVHASFQQLGVASPDAESAPSDAGGHFAASGLAPGRYSVCFAAGAVTAADPTGVLSTCGHPQHVTVRAGHLTSGIRARLSPAGAVAGKVTDSSGRAFADRSGLEVSVGDDQVSVRKDGTFFAPGLRDGRYRVCAISFEPAISGRSCAPARVAVVAGHTSRGIHLTLEPTVRVVVHVSDAAGNPLAGADAALLAPCSSRASDDGQCSTQPLFSSSRTVVIAANAVTNSNGRATLYVPKAGKYAVCTYGYWAGSATDNVATGYGDACHDTSFATVVGSTPVSVDQTLAASGAVTGQVTDAAGHPIAGAQVRISNSAATDYRTSPADISYANYGDPTVPTPKAEARTDADGRYTIYSVAAGAQQVCATAPKSAASGHGCLAAPVTVTAGATTSAAPLTVSS